MAATINYFKTEDVKIFPCAYRGYRGSAAEAIDPSARSFTEYNFSNIYSNISASKPSYIISYDTADSTNTVLKCVVGGYYFEISHVNTYINNFKWLGIQLSKIDENNSKSRVLIPIRSSNVDYLDPRENGNFLGLSYSPEKDDDCDFTLQVFDDDKKIYEKSKRLEDSFGHGVGKYSLYSADNENASEANGFHSIALGRNNTVNHEYSTAIGKNLNTSANHQILLGEGYGETAYEAEENIAIQMVKAGTDKTENIISISKTGDIKTNNFEVVDGNLVAKGNANIGEDLVKINKAVEADTEQGIEAADAKVEINCDTAIDGKLNVTGETSIKNKLIVNDNVNLASGLLKVTKADTEQSAKAKINCDTDIIGATNITGNTTITGTTTSTDLITGNNGLIVTAGNTSLQNTTVNGTLATTGKLTIGEENAVAGADIYGNTVVYGKLTSTNGVNLQNGTTKVITHTIENAGTDNEKSVTTLEADTIKLNGEIEAENLKLNKINFEDKAELKVYSFEGNNLVPSTQTEGFTIKNTNALANLQGGLHLGGMITIYSNKQTPNEMLYTGLAIYDSSEQQENANLVTKLKTDGTAYFSQKLIVGGNKEDINISTSGSGADDIADYPSKLEIQGGWLWSDVYRTIIKDKLAVGGDAYIGGDIKTGIKSTVKVGQVITLNPDNNNSIIAIAYNTPSDIRRKQNITNFEAKKSLLDLDVKEFEYIDDADHKKHIGCIAQELQEICPEIVYEDTDGYLSIEENKLVYLLLNEVKKLKKEVEELKGE